ncbi:hypothetical protein M0R45_015083 [Rubus argutus]|uniref:Uncharacterized protein n=1 Tax=Rubus argutus TaxID=59490 RepID=A0AAW1XPR4_RUBAR
MDSRQHFGFSATGAGLSYTASHPTIPSIPNRLLGSLKFDIGNSPNSPFSTHFDSDSVTTLSDSQEQHSSTENLSGVSPSPNSPFETNSYIHRLSLSPSVDCRRDCLQLSSGRASLLQDANCSPNIKHALQELESALMGPDEEVTTTTTFGESSGGRDRDPWHRQSEKRHKVLDEASLQRFPADNLQQLLIACAEALSHNYMDDFENLIARARGAVSISGEPIQRLGAYMVEGLVARKEASGTNIYRALRCREPDSNDLLSYMHILYEICPYLKFGYMAANGAIADACRNEDRIHIIDFQIAQGTQWVTLLQALAARPSGAPHVRITVEFHGVPVFALDVTRDMLDVRPGEALAVNFPLLLHHTPDESVDVNNPRDGLLRIVKSLSPKVTTLVEQESNTNTTPFLNRFIETLDFYLAMFESIDVTLPRNSKERINVEQHCLARDIVNVIACEGKERVERHVSFPSSLESGSPEHYKLEEKDGAMLLGWKDRNLVSASAWC